MTYAAWPRSLRGQMIALILIGLSLAQALSFILSSLQHQYTFEAIHDENTLTRIASLVHIMAETPPELHERVQRAVSSRLLQVSIGSAPILETQASTAHSLHLQQQLARLLNKDSADVRLGLRTPLPTNTALPLEPRHPPRPPHHHGSDQEAPFSTSPEPRPGPRPPPFPPHGPPPGPRAGHGPGRHRPPPPPMPGLAVAVRLDEGRWLNVLSAAPPPSFFWQWSTLLSLSCAALVLSGLMILMVRRITQPLAHLVLAADRFGRGEAAVPLPERGPRDVQEALRAFNQMQERLARFVQNRTRMLAAMSHDLRTPLTVLRMRAELLDDVGARDKIIATLDEMQRLTEATLAFVREEAAEEETRRLDLDALLASVCDDLSDAGYEVQYTSPGRILYRGRSMGLRRALCNLVENAAFYGQRARVSLTEEPASLCLVIDDDGPGLEEADLERVFEPFVRLETSRSRDTGGVGLGLAIARSIVQAHGGEIRLANRPEGGLRVTIRLPTGMIQA